MLLERFKSTLKAISIGAAISVLSFSALSQTPATTIETIDNHLKKFHQLKEFNGSVLIAKNGKVILKKGYGKANIEWHIPNSPQTKFRLGSISKQFTAMLIMQLVQEGKIDLHAPMSKYLPDYRADNAAKITVHHLLNHTSGIPNYTAQQGFRKISRTKFSVDEFVTQHCSRDLEFEPGSNFRYSNSGYFILGSIIERVSGKTYAELLQEKIFTPLHMKDSGYDSFTEIIEQRATGYQQNLDGFKNAEFLDMSIPYAAGSLYSTVEDLLRWDAALYDFTLLSKKLTRLMYQPSEQEKYGYGWSIDKLDEKTYGKALTNINHGGGINGFNTKISRIVEDKILVVLLNNTGGAPLTRITDSVLKILYGLPVDMPQPDISRELYGLIKEGKVNEASSRFKSVFKDAEGRKRIRENTLNNLGYALLSMGDINNAIVMFKLNTEVFPDYANGFDSLGEAYALNQNNKLALAAYKKALELDANNGNAKGQIEKLSALINP